MFFWHKLCNTIKYAQKAHITHKRPKGRKANIMYQKIHSDNNMFWLKANKESQNRLHGKASGQKSYYGHKIECQGGKIDTLVIAGRFTINEMAALVCFKTDAKSIKRVKQHLYAKLRNILNIDIQADNKGRIYAACNAESAANNKLVHENETKQLNRQKMAKVRHIAAQKKIQKTKVILRKAK